VAESVDLGVYNAAVIIPDNAHGIWANWIAPISIGNGNVMAQRFGPGLEPLTPAIRIGRSTDISDVKGVLDNSEGLFSVWQLENDPVTHVGSVRAQHIDNLGSVSWDPEGIIVNDFNPPTQVWMQPKIVSDGLNGCVILYNNSPSFYVYREVHAARLNAAGEVLWQRGYDSLVGELIDIDSHTHHSVVIAWYSLISRYNYNAYFSIIDSAGNLAANKLFGNVGHGPLTDYQPGFHSIKSDRYFSYYTSNRCVMKLNEIDSGWSEGVLQVSPPYVVTTQHRLGSKISGLYFGSRDTLRGDLWGILDNRSWAWRDSMVQASTQSVGNFSKTGCPMSDEGIGLFWTDSYHYYGQLVAGNGILGDTLYTGIQETEFDSSRYVTLECPYPNPAHGTVIVNYALERAGPMRLSVRDLLGREVALLLQKELPPGAYRAQWEPLVEQVGRFFVVLECGGETYAKAMVVR
jgi:hypothetical protein